MIINESFDNIVEGDNMNFIQIVDLTLPAQQPAESIFFFFVSKEGLERALTLLLL
jgi:hypothetical protein